MGRRPYWLVGPLLVAALAAGCAGMRHDEPEPEVVVEERNPEAELELGIAALQRGDFALARDHLSSAYARCWAEMPGRRALLVLASLEIDPRNPSRRPDVAARLAADYLRMPEPITWLEPVAEGIYLTALDLGAQPPGPPTAPGAGAPADSAPPGPRPLSPDAAFPDDCDPDDPPYVAARPLPQLQGPTAVARLQNLQQQRDTLTGRVAEMEARLTALQKQLAAREEELARIRKTLRP